MKKLLSIALVLVLILSLGTVAFADGDYTDVSTITITKHFKDTNGGVSPAETFTFSDFTQVDIKENSAATWPSTKPTITSIAYSEGNATADGTGTGAATATITLPTYTAVGVYTYSFTEVTPTTKTAGITYNSNTFYLVVTVVQDGTQKRVAAVHCEGSRDAGTYGTSPKTDIFDNSYESGTLAVTKSVTGNLGDKSKYFDVTVTFTAASGETINSTITYTGGKYGNTAVTVSNNTATIQVKDGDTVTFANVPEGVTWKVEEADYTSEANGKYDAATYTTQTATMTAGGQATCTITNNKDITVDTGISLDSLPYIVIAVLVVAALAVMMIRKRRYSED